LFIGGALILREKLLYWVLPVFFTAYLTYGFIRPRVSRRVREEIEDDDDDEPSSPS
jgi:CDP-diacylglycerol--serine O-phosphatidyltransferase